MAILANSTITLVSYLDAYGAAVEGGYEGSIEDFYNDLGLVEELPAVYSTVQSHDGQLTSHGAIFTAMAVSTNQQGQVVGVEKTYSELTSKQLSIEEHLSIGGVNLLDNATYGSREAPDDGLWCGDETVCYVIARLGDLTIDDALDVIDDLTIAQFLEMGW